MYQNTYVTFKTLQQQNIVKFKPNTPNTIKQQIDNLRILKFSLDKINIKLYHPSSQSIPSIYNQSSIKTNPTSQQIQQMNLKLIHAFSFIQQVNLEQIKFFKQLCSPTLLLTISNVNLYSLQILQLNQCNIDSIQFLSFFYLPSLRRLLLNNNKLVHLNSFSKISFPRLFWIELIYNQIQDAKGLQRTNIARRMALLEVSQKTQRQNMDVFTYLPFWFYKLPFQHVNYIRKKQSYLQLSRNNIHVRKAKSKFTQLDFR